MKKATCKTETEMGE